MQHTRKVWQFTLEHESICAADEVVELNNFVWGELVEEKAAKCVLAFAEDGKERYRNFRNERFVEKSLKLVIQSKPTEV